MDNTLTPNELMRERLKKLDALRALGVDPYGGRYETTGTTAQILAAFEEGKHVRAAGRITALRSFGKSTFIDLRDSSGRVQVYVKAVDLPELDQKVFELIDLGDFASVEGDLFITKTGEKSIKAKTFRMQSKSLRSLPEKWHGLKDVETRFRHRYLDLASNEEAKKIFQTRSHIVSGVRRYLDGKDYLEVETPMMHPIPGGAAGKPFKTHHEALNTDLFLRVAPELYLKKLLVGGYEKVYEINTSFRNEGISTRHNPEFTMLEVYTAYHDVTDVMKLCEGIIQHAAQEAFGTLRFEREDHVLDLTEFRRISFADLMQDNFGIKPDDPMEKWVEKLKEKGHEFKDLSRMQLIHIVAELLNVNIHAVKDGKKVVQPVMVTEYFTELCPLAKKNPKNPHISDRFELYVGGMEIANGYTELNDPIDQRERLLAELKEKGKDATADTLDEDFLLALEHGMPPAGGLGIGIDRLVMMLTGQPTIREVILFPQMKPEKTA